MPAPTPEPARTWAAESVLTSHSSRPPVSPEYLDLKHDPTIRDRIEELKTLLESGHVRHDPAPLHIATTRPIAKGMNTDWTSIIPDETYKRQNVAPPAEGEILMPLDPLTETSTGEVYVFTEGSWRSAGTRDESAGVDLKFTGSLPPVIEADEHTASVDVTVDVNGDFRLRVGNLISDSMMSATPLSSISVYMPLEEWVREFYAGAVQGIGAEFTITRTVNERILTETVALSPEIVILATNVARADIAKVFTTTSPLLERQRTHLREMMALLAEIDEDEDIDDDDIS